MCIEPHQCSEIGGQLVSITAYCALIVATISARVGARLFLFTADQVVEEVFHLTAPGKWADVTVG